MVRSEEQKKARVWTLFTRKIYWERGLNERHFLYGMITRDRWLPRLSAVCRIREMDGQCFIFTVLMTIFSNGKACRFNEQGFHFTRWFTKIQAFVVASQKFNDIRDLRAYFEEITFALQVIREEGNWKTFLLGHSTEG